MRKMFMRIIGILGSFILVISMMPLTVSAEELPVPAHEKYVTSNGDGTYTLTLNVTGKEETEAVKTPADVLLIIDVSKSMNEWMGSDTRLGIVKSLTSNLAADILPVGTVNRMAAVSFSGTKYDDGVLWNDAFEVADWTNSATDITSKVNGLSVLNGTNWEAGFQVGNNKMETSRENAQKYVVFLSDGDPTYHYDDNGASVGKGDRTSDNDVSEAIVAAKEINNATIYSVGIGGNVTRMKELADAVGGAYYDGTSEDAMANAFAAIESQITKNYSGIVISDTLSDYAEMVDPEKLFVSASDAQGNEVSIPDGTSAVYHEDSRTVTLTFPNSYVLKSNVTYSIGFAIRPTQAALDKYIELGQSYPDTGDTGTGDTSAGKAGLYSNESATVDYVKTTGSTTQDLSEDYAKPVIQVAYTPITELPKAGGPGTWWVFAVGFGMVGFAGTLLIIQKKRQGVKNQGGLYD